MNTLNFLNIPLETQQKLLQAGEIKEVPKGTILIRGGEKISTVYYQLSGKSIIYNLTYAGKRKILFVLGAENLLNEHIFDDYDSSVFCEMIEDSKIFECPLPIFLALMEEDFHLTKSVLRSQEKKIWRLSHQLKNTMSNVYLERKLAAKIWKLAKDFGMETDEGIEIDLNLSVTFMADMLGAPRETASRICSVLTGHGLIKMNKKRVTILQPELMERFYKTGKIV